MHVHLEFVLKKHSKSPMRYCFKLTCEHCGNGLVRFRSIGGSCDSYLTTVFVSREEIESFLKDLYKIEADSENNQLKSFGLFERLFFRLRGIVLIREIKRFIHPKYDKSLWLYIARDRSSKLFFYVRSKWFHREKTFFSDYDSTKKVFEVLKEGLG